MSGREHANEIEADAVRWVWRLDAEGRTPALEAELQAWLDGDSRRCGALLQAEAAWAMLDVARPADIALKPAPTAARLRPGRRAVLAGGGAIAASLAGLATVLMTRERYGTRVGEIRRVPLQDGSTAAINTQSLVDVAMTPEVRVVTLARGEAWFNVAKNAKRPFVVKAGEVRVRAVGTAFSVRRLGSAVEVLVTEGVVETWTTASPDQRIRLVAGAKAWISDDAGIVERAAQASEIDRKLAWRSGEIDLAGETLAEAVAEFNRYNERKLVISDRSLLQQSLYGVFRTDDPEGFAKAAGVSLGAAVSVMEGGAIQIGANQG